MKKSIILIISLFALNQLWAQKISCKNVQTLELNYSFDRERFDHFGWSLLDEKLNDKSIFFLGESHNILSNRKMHFSVFSYLYYKADVRLYVKEGNFSEIYLLNKYVQTGEEKYLKGIHEMVNEILLDKNEYLKEITDNYFLQIKAFRDFYKSLAPDDKFVIIGIDSEPFYNANIVVKTLLDPIKSIPHEIQPAIDSLLSFKSRSPFPYLNSKDKARIRPLLSFLNDNFNTYQKLYKDYFGDDYVLFEMILNNQDIIKRRESDLFNRFVKMNNFFGRENCNSFFQYGSLHAELNGNSLANLINKSQEFRGQVLSIGTQYNNCSYWYGKFVENQNFGAISKSTKRIQQEYSSIIEKCVKSDYSIMGIEKSMGSSTEDKLGFSYIINISNQ